MSINNLNTYLNIKDSHLRVVSGNVYAQAMNIGGINVETAHGLQSVSNTGNVTSNTLQFSNAITGFVTTANAQIGRDLVVSGNTTVSKELTVTSNATVSSNLNVSDDLIVTNNILASNNLTVTGNATISGNVHAGGEIELYSNLNIQQVSNTATIKATSNVVTEFPRSKKLIKYPRVALTSAAETGSGYEGYIVTRSSQFSSYNAWEAFDENNPAGTGQEGAGAGWASTIPGTYSVSTGAETGSVEHHTGSTQGEWIQIQLPESIYLHDFVIESRSEITYNASGFDHGFPEGCVLYGSNDGSSWVVIKSFTTVDKNHSRAHTENINETTQTYKYFALVVNSTHVYQNTTQVSHVSIGQIRLFGTPEYDPEAHGTDVTVKSYPNVPNTDWLEVYYDAKNYTSGVVQDETTNDRDAEMNATFDNGEIKAFSFSGAATSNVTTSDHGLGTGDVTYTMSYWLKRTAVAGSYDYVVQLGNGGVAYSSVLMWINNNQLTLDHWGSALRVLDPIILDTWYHVAAGHSGGNTPSLENDFIYINGKKVTPEITQIAAPFTLAGSKLILGSGVGGRTEGSIANFRLFNRALTSDEIYQLYAYQKEDFGHGDLSMTFKAGRLGIGTSEPRAMLDVRGNINCDGVFKSKNPIAFAVYRDYATPSRDHSYTGNALFNTVHYNHGGHFDTSISKFIVPVKGLYHFGFSAYTNQSAGTQSRLRIMVDPVGGGATTYLEQKGFTIQMHGNSINTNVYCDAGDKIWLSGNGTGQRIYMYTQSGHNRFYGYLIYAL